MRSFVTCTLHQVLLKLQNKNGGGACSMHERSLMIGKCEGGRSLGRPTPRWRIVFKRIIKK
jgi:hypothetical protein